MMRNSDEMGLYFILYLKKHFFKNIKTALICKKWSKIRRRDTEEEEEEEKRRPTGRNTARRYQ